jgi:hypothetical protein
MLPDWVTVDVASVSGLSVIVGGTVVALIRGWLVSSRQVDRLEKSYQRQLTDAWATATANGARADVLQAQQQRLMEAAYPVLGKVPDEMA